MNKGSKKTDIVKLVGVALFTAIVVVLQYLGSFIKFGPFSISLVLVPIVIGAALYGRTAGAWLGFVFSVVVLLQPDTALFYQANFAGTIITVLLKGTLAGFRSGLQGAGRQKCHPCGHCRRLYLSCSQYGHLPARFGRILYGYHQDMGERYECVRLYDCGSCGLQFPF